jgi:exonuclease VII large subunit
MEDGSTVCDAETVSETTLQNIVLRSINRTLGGKDEMLEKLQQNVESVILDNTTEDIDTHLTALQEDLVKAVGNQEKIDKIAEQIDDLRSQKEKVILKNAEHSTLMERIADMRVFLEHQTGRITEYDEQLVRRMIEKIMIFDDKYEVVFKSGASVVMKR